MSLSPESRDASLLDVSRLLSEGLNLCVRGRKLDDAVMKAEIAGGIGDLDRRHDQTRCLTPALWVIDQYDNDVAEWEARARTTLSKLPEFALATPPPPTDGEVK